MFYKRWIAHVVTLPILLVAAGTYGKVTDLVKALPPDEIQFRRSIYEAYIRLRDGVQPSADTGEKRNLLRGYAASLAGALAAGRRLPADAPESCRRFMKLYEKIGVDTRDTYTRYLNDQNLDEMTFVNLEARLQTLRLFEAGLFSLVLFNAEGGFSDLDASKRVACDLPDRSEWRNKLLDVHQDLETLHFAVFGLKSMNDPITESSALSELNRRYKVSQNKKKAVWITGEIVSSVLIWEKGIGKLLKGRGRIVQIFAGAAYVMGWVKFDREMRTRVDFLKLPPEIIAPGTFSGWERLISLGEEFSNSDPISPPLYLEYLRLIDKTERQRALDFLTENEWVLVDAEETFGSVDNAYQKFKEVSGL